MSHHHKIHGHHPRPPQAAPQAQKAVPKIDQSQDLEAMIAQHKAWMEQQLAQMRQQQMQSQQPGSTLPNTSPPPVNAPNPYAGYPAYSARSFDPNMTVPQSPRQYGPPEDLSQAKVFGRPVETNSSHDLFWHYFGGSKAPQTNEESRAMISQMQDKFGPFGFKVEPIEHDRLDKIRITGPDGKVEEVDFIYAMGGEKGDEKLQWLANNPVGPGAAGGAVDEGFVMSIMNMFEATNEGIKQALEVLKKRPGYENTKLLDHPTKLDKLRFSNGQVVDVIVGSGGPNPRWGWQPE